MCLQLFLKPEDGPTLLFTILDRQGKTAFELKGKILPFGCRCILRTPDGKTAARLSGVCIPGSFQYTAVHGSHRVRMRVHPDSLHRPVMFKGMPWRFRGNLVTRSFDVVEDVPGDSTTRVVMAHDRCWTAGRNCYALTIPRSADVPLAVCVAAALDSSVQTGCFSPVPAG